MLEFSHNPWLVLASLCVALMAGFTGLSLTQGLSDQTFSRRKVTIAIASIALGGGIWSMHFVAMLGLQLPILFSYDSLITLASALVAILVVGLALLILHFRERTPASLTLAGLIVGFGILAMHYIGMSGLELCRTVYTVTGVLTAVAASCILSVSAFWVAYGRRTHRNIILGTLCFGLSVFLVHFIAISGTGFLAVENTNATGPLISNEVMAIGVVLSSFVLCGAFLLTGVTFLPNHENGPVIQKVPEHDAAQPHREQQQIPYEFEGRTLFVDRADVAALRAEGHYTILYTKSGKHFCVWPISEAEMRLTGSQFIKSHRSYLINPTHVSSFERLKDNGICYFDSIATLEKVPVSRSRLTAVREALGL